MQTIEIVVARFKEDISWVKTVEKMGYEVTIYNKYEGENLLPNVGREAHTYLTHILKKKENLADVTAFLQGDPHYHCKELIQKLDAIRNQAFDFAVLSDNIIMCDVNGVPGCGFPGDPFIPVGKHYEWVTGKKSPQVFVSPANAQFAVSKKMILSNSEEIYQRALTSVSYDQNPVEAHCLERSWLSLFGNVSNESLSILRYDLENGIDVHSYLAQHLRIDMLGELGTYAR